MQPTTCRLGYGLVEGQVIVVLDGILQRELTLRGTYVY